MIKNIKLKLQIKPVIKLNNSIKCYSARSTIGE